MVVFKRFVCLFVVPLLLFFTLVVVAQDNVTVKDTVKNVSAQSPKDAKDNAKDTDEETQDKADEASEDTYYLADQTDENEPSVTQVDDPYEKFNRAMFRFNEVLDDNFLKPIAKGYNAIMPTPLNNGIDNFFENLTGIPTVINDLLQFEFYQATSDSWRFAVNSTIGLLGFLDVATRIDLLKHNEDVGLTFAKWGWKKSNYLVLPFFGSHTVRDALGLPIYYFMTIYPYIDEPEAELGLLALRVVDIRAQLLRFGKVYEEVAVDKYVFMRSAYLQRRAYLINNGKELDDTHTVSEEKKEAANNDEETYYLEDV